MHFYFLPISATHTHTPWRLQRIRMSCDFFCGTLSSLLFTWFRLLNAFPLSSRPTGWLLACTFGFSFVFSSTQINEQQRQCGIGTNGGVNWRKNDIAVFTLLPNFRFLIRILIFFAFFCFWRQVFFVLLGRSPTCPLDRPCLSQLLRVFGLLRLLFFLFFAQHCFWIRWEFTFVAALLVFLESFSLFHLALVFFILAFSWVGKHFRCSTFVALFVYRPCNNVSGSLPKTSNRTFPCKTRKKFNKKESTQTIVCTRLLIQFLMPKQKQNRIRMSASQYTHSLTYSHTWPYLLKATLICCSFVCTELQMHQSSWTRKRCICKAKDSSFTSPASSSSFLTTGPSGNKLVAPFDLFGSRICVPPLDCNCEQNEKASGTAAAAAELSNVNDCAAAANLHEAAVGLVEEKDGDDEADEGSLAFWFDVWLAVPALAVDSVSPEAQRAPPGSDWSVELSIVFNIFSVFVCVCVWMSVCV